MRHFYSVRQNSTKVVVYRRKQTGDLGEKKLILTAKVRYNIDIVHDDKTQGEQKMEQTNEKKNLQAMVLEDIVGYARECYVASFQKENDETLLIRFVGGRTVRVMVTEVEAV